MSLDKLTIVGAGLLGGSLGLAARERGLAKRVTALVRRPESVSECHALGVADEVTQGEAEAITGADLVILCTPVASMAGLAKRCSAHLKKGAIVTDVGSTKRQLMEDLTPLIAEAGAHFVGSHPMAGSAQTGPSAATAALFDGAVCVVTTTDTTDATALQSVNEFWEALGSTIVAMSADEHDQLVARCSHLPHLLSSTLAKRVLDPQHGELQKQICATGFRDMSRLASGSPVIWRDIVRSNREAILTVIDEFTDELEQLRTRVSEDNGENIERWLNEAKLARDEWRASGLD